MGTHLVPLECFTGLVTGQEKLSVETEMFTGSHICLPSLQSVAETSRLFLGVCWEIEELIAGLEKDGHVVEDGFRAGTSEVEIKHSCRLARLPELLDLGGIFVRYGFVVDYGQRGLLRLGRVHGHDGQPLARRLRANTVKLWVPVSRRRKIGSASEISPLLKDILVCNQLPDLYSNAQLDGQHQP